MENDIIQRNSLGAGNMVNKYSNILGSIIIGICILIGSFLISNGHKDDEDRNNIKGFKVQEQEDKVLLTEDEAAQYLNISKSSFNSIIMQQIKDKSSLASYNTYKYIPYIVIEGKRFYSKDQINKWVDYNMLNK